MNGIMGFDLGKNEARIMKAMDDWAEDVVKNCTIPDVSNRREQLIAWNDWMKNNYPDYIPIPLYIIDKFLSN